MAFSSLQRRAILVRDEYKCQAPFVHRCCKALEVHHLICQRYGYEMGMTEDILDSPMNALTICKNAHNIIHPDRAEAYRLYRSDKDNGSDSFVEMGKTRDKMLKRREIYWNSQFDRQMMVVAWIRTSKAMKNGWSLPLKKVKNVKR